MKKNICRACIIDIFFIIGLSCNPDPHTVLTKNQDILRKTFSQIQKAGSLIKYESIAPKKMEQLPERIRVLNAYYTSADYKGHNAIIIPLYFCENLKDEMETSLDIGYHQPITNLADAFIGKNTNYYSNTYGKILDDIKALKKIQYLVIVKTIVSKPPIYDPQENSFYRGEYRGEVYLFRLSDLHYFGSVSVNASNSETIDIPDRTGSYSHDERTFVYNTRAGKYTWTNTIKTTTFDRGNLEKRGKDAVLMDLRIQIDRAIQIAVPLTSWNPFIKD